MKQDIKAGDFIECYPADRETLRRVAVVGRVSTYNDGALIFFKAVMLAVTPEDGSFYSLSVHAMLGSDEGRTWRRLQVRPEDVLGAKLDGVIAECEAAAEPLVDQRCR